jgi:hypothetical protein
LARWISSSLLLCEKTGKGYTAIREKNAMPIAVIFLPFLFFSYGSSDISFAFANNSYMESSLDGFFIYHRHYTCQMKREKQGIEL